MSFRSHQNSDHLPSLAVLPTSGDEYRLPSIGIRNRLPAKRVLVPDGSGLGTFRMTLVRPLHFHSVPNQPSSTSRLTDIRWHQPTTALRLNASATFRWPKYTRRLRSLTGRGLLGHRHSSPLQHTHITRAHLDTPTLRRCIFETISTETRRLLAALGVNLEPLPASLYHLV